MIIFSTFFVILIWTVVILLGLRNKNLVTYRYKLIDLISKAIAQDIENNQTYNFMWRYQVLNSVNYNEMLFKFWRPFSSFYPNQSFLRPMEIQGKRKSHPNTDIFKKD